jgi:hypothetical protein
MNTTGKLNLAGIIGPYKNYSFIFISFEYVINNNTISTLIIH